MKKKENCQIDGVSHEKIEYLRRVKEFETLDTSTREDLGFVLKTIVASL